MREEIDGGIKRHGVVEHEKYGKIYAYEVDGLGNALLEDDANIPSLLSIPYLGYDYHPEIFANTKRFILSGDNPWFHSGNSDGTEYSGIGLPHTHFIPSSIWPMAMIMEGLISKNSTEKAIPVKNPPPAPRSLFLGVASRSASGRDLTRVPKPNSDKWETDE